MKLMTPDFVQGGQRDAVAFDFPEKWRRHREQCRPAGLPLGGVFATGAGFQSHWKSAGARRSLGEGGRLDR
jgi:hypothetical protein